MKLDAEARTATLSTKEEVGFGKALLATGANVRRLRVDGGDLEGIHYLRALGNAASIRADAEQAERVVLIGGSYIACEVAASLTAMGKQLHARDARGRAARPATSAPRPAASSPACCDEHGIELRDGGPAGALRGRRAACSAWSPSRAASLDADLVVLGTGAMPDVMLARSSGLELGETGGVRCSQTLETSAEGIWAAGDPCEYDSVVHGRRLRVEHFEVAAAQGRHAAAAMLGQAGPLRRDPLLLVRPRRLVHARVRRAGRALGPRGRPRLARRRRVHDLLPRRGPARRRATVGRSDDLEHAKRLIAGGRAARRPRRTRSPTRVERDLAAL